MLWTAPAERRLHWETLSRLGSGAWSRTWKSRLGFLTNHLVIVGTPAPTASAWVDWVTVAFPKVRS